VIRCESLSHAYPDGTTALDRLDLEIPAGERVAITGPNGAGKTTLVHHWNGLLRPTAGRVLIDGRPTDGLHVAELARSVGLTFQRPERQLFAASCRAEVAFGPRTLGLRGAALDDRVDAALSAVGLAAEGPTNPYDLGGARRRLLAIASVLALNTAVVVLDEPTTGLDAAQVALVEALVDGLAGAGRTVVAISHDARFVAAGFRRVVRLTAGRVVADG
jgi:energy-coupling factor transport system ATP-binding protein